MGKSSEEFPDLPFDVPLLSAKPIESKYAPYQGHVWTKNKAALIARYLRHFLFVTKGACYIDAFAGHQREESHTSTWAAKLALEQCAPDRLRRVYLFEKDPAKIHALNLLKKQHDQGWTKLSTRKVEVIEGDSNVTISEYFNKLPLKQNLATFCLLDQWTRECDWETVRYISKLKSKNKAEIFYFLAQGWMDRSWNNLGARNQHRIAAWWGNKDWLAFSKLKSFERARVMEVRFKRELGYCYAQAFPIHKYGNHGRVMFWMIHASDDQRAVPLMAKAYREIGLGIPFNEEQMVWNNCFEFD